MKKAKIMLSAVTVLAVVGGALAFKAKKFNDVTFYTTSAGTPNNCSFAVPILYTITSGPGSGVISHIIDYTTVLGVAKADCTVTAYTFD